MEKRRQSSSLWRQHGQTSSSSTGRRAAAVQAKELHRRQGTSSRTGARAGEKEQHELAREIEEDAREIEDHTRELPVHWIMEAGSGDAGRGSRRRTRGSSSRMRGSAMDDARELEEDARGFQEGRARQEIPAKPTGSGRGPPAQVWAAAAEEVIGDDGESRYLATAEELSWARRPLANHAAGWRRPLATRRRRAEEEDGAEGLV
ncbi:uncharacterized protein [Triticum aestivum]|uniref:uncharacterized protein n=1 Tax=Triticum aestivum TaxID=4565 RepID=UPI001D01C9A4|nr:uncharacterized protein LOC123176861 [Triticum aestivum]XP_044446829.1 uncharacterized protein LOC123176861 [Triticum aestivum]XP_044446830.1 uncharacterized protein LOC123176861 [Triticum aestivum]XP_044446831.1 uncharacterized protein LOC123176861 [Triticum aestivum]XP_044446832.1 uncharacterized protein LOC123176861 [Triticum aestivum]XP_044446833.1 uncharacterized protein LOC123176861 [Triticum aestivum]XP_044446834.1 uncharacterized protein LOC123176861 [Triticum aestivum]